MVEPKEKLLPLISEKRRKYVDYYISFLEKMKTPEDMTRVVLNSEDPWSGGYNQTFGPMMIVLYNENEEVRRDVHSKVGELGISDEAITSYFTNHIKNGSIAVIMHMKDMVPKDKKNDFIELTGLLMLDHLKSYAGLEELAF